MKQELTPNQAAHLLLEDENASWTYNGAIALCEYLEENYPEMEFNVGDIRCSYNEYESATAAAEDYSDFSCDKEAEALEYLQDNTTVIVFNGGIIIQEF